MTRTVHLATLLVLLGYSTLSYGFQSHRISTLRPSLKISVAPTSQDKAVEPSVSEWALLQQGVEDLQTGRAFDGSNLSRAVATPHDFIGVVANVPLALESLHTAVTGQLHPTNCIVCSIIALVCGWAHAIMANNVPRDYRAPRLAEYHTVYEFSALYLVPFAWLLARITPNFPTAWECFDPWACTALTAVTLYGSVYALWGKRILKQQDTTLLPSSADYQKQAQLYLTGNVVINALACLFLPFAWTLTIRGTEWWERVQTLHPNEAAFLAVSVLVAIVGDTVGNLLLRLRELNLIRSEPGIVVLGILSNFLFLLFPELVFNLGYHDGVSEIGFYWE